MITPTDLTYTTTRIVKSLTIRWTDQNLNRIPVSYGSMVFEFTDGTSKTIDITSECDPDDFPSVGRVITTTRVLCAYPLGHDDGIPF